MSAGAILNGLAPRERQSLGQVAAPFLVALSYFLGAKAAFAIGMLTQQFAPFWPPNAVLLCAFLRMPRRQWPAIILACLPAHILAEIGAAMPALQLIAAFACNVTVALLNAVALVRFVPRRDWFSGLDGTVRYLAITVVANPALVACAAGFEPLLGNGHLGDYGQFWWRWYVSNALGNLTLAPLFLTATSGLLLRGFRLADRGRVLEVALLMSGLAISCGLAFTSVPSAAAGLFPVLIYLAMPFLLAIAVRLLAALAEELRHSNKDLALALDKRNCAEIAARATRALLQSSLNALGSRFAILDASGRILTTNASWDDAATLIAQRGEQHFVGRNYLEECDRGRPHQQQIAAGLRRVIGGEVPEFRLEYRSDSIGGRWYQVRGTRFVIERELRVVVAHEDITEVKRSEDALRRLSGRLMRAQDESRRQIARDLHDSTAQSLLAARLGIGQALRRSPRLTRATRAALEESRALIDESQREIRTVAYLLHPPLLDEAGLAAALRWLSDGFSKRTEIDIALDLAEDIERLPAETEAALFRVAQEALTNVHRHSGSRTARIVLRRTLAPQDGSQVVMAIEDNGCGMPAEFAPPLGDLPHDRHLGIGLTGMRERLHQLGGNLRIEWSARGTTVQATIPCG